MAKYSRKKKFRRSYKRTFKRHSKKVPKKIKRAIKDTMMRAVESKFASIDVVVAGTTHTTPGTVKQFTVTSIYPIIDQGISRHMRLGNQIIIKKMWFNFLLETNPGSGAAWMYRILVWKSKLLSNKTSGEADIVATFTGTTPAIYKSFENSEDVTIYKDTGVRCVGEPLTTGRSLFQHKFYLPQHKVMFATNDTDVPTDRMYMVTLLIQAAETAQTFSYYVRSECKYKDP